MSVFISDCHMGPGEKWDWFSRTEAIRLIDFCRYLTYRYLNQKDLKEVILLGDIFDLWVCPYDQAPHSFRGIMKHQSMVFNAMQKMAAIVPTFYVNGNHDFRVTPGDIEEAFDGHIICLKDGYRNDNVLAIHGHQQALFNKPDPKNGGKEALPIGYFITRLYTSLVMGNNVMPNLVAQIINEGLQALGPETLTESILDALKDSIRDTLNKEVVSFNMGYLSEDYEYETIRARYKNLFQDWLDEVGLWKTIQMLMCEVDRLGSTADQLCTDGINIVIMGHSHGTKMDKDSILSQERIYANCGYWCGLDKKDKGNDAHYVQTNGSRVELCSFRGGKSTIKKFKTISPG